MKIRPQPLKRVNDLKFGDKIFVKHNAFEKTDLRSNLNGTYLTFYGRNENFIIVIEDNWFYFPSRFELIEE